MSEYDMKLICIDCGREFDFPVEEQRYFMRNGYSMPKRCRECRTIADAKMPASAMAAALEAQQKAVQKKAAFEPAQTPVAPREREVEQMAEPIRATEPITQPAPQPVVQPAPQAEPEPVVQPTPQPARMIEYVYYLVVDGNKYVSIDNEKKMVNIRADMKDLFDSHDEAMEWRDFLADKGVVAQIRETPKNI